MTSVMFALVIVENAQGRGEAEEFVLRQTKLPSPRMLMAKIIVDGKCFVEEDAIGFQGVNDDREQRPMQVKKDDDGIITFVAQAGRVIRRGFQVEDACRETGETLCARSGFQCGEGVGVSIDGLHL